MLHFFGAVFLTSKPKTLKNKKNKYLFFKWLCLIFSSRLQMLKNNDTKKVVQLLKNLYFPIILSRSSTWHKFCKSWNNLQTMTRSYDFVNIFLKNFLVGIYGLKKKTFFKIPYLQMSTFWENLELRKFRPMSNFVYLWCFDWIVVDLLKIVFKSSKL